MENYEEKRHGLTIKIYADEDPQAPDDWGNDNVFLVAYHQDFWVEGPKVFYKLPEGVKRDPRDKGHLLFSKDEVRDLLEKRGNKEYHVFGLEAYIHSSVRLALSQEGNFCDRRWDVSQLGAVFVSKKEARIREKAENIARNLVDTWNDYLSGNVYNYLIEDDSGEVIDSLSGIYGDYKENALAEARALVDHLTESGKTDHHGQILINI